MRLAVKLIVFSSLSAFLVGCSSFDTRSAKPGATASKGGGYYKDDGPGDNIPTNLADIPDAVPWPEPLHRGASRPYTALGREYVPMTDASGFRQKGLASWYGRRYHGKPTSSGELYDMYAMTAAHPTLPIPSYVRVTNPANKRSVVVRINDRGPFHDDRAIDLSYTAAWKLDILKGVTPVEVVALDPYSPPPAPVKVAAKPASMPTASVVAPPPIVMTALPPVTTTTPQPVATTTPPPVTTTTPQPVATTTPQPVAMTAPPPVTMTAAPALKMATTLPVTMATTTPVAVVAPATVAATRPVSAPMPSTPGNGRATYLQLGAFGNPEGAEALVRQVQQRLGASLPGVLRLQVGSLTKVQAGPFAGVAQADLAAEAVLREIGIRPFKVNR